MAGGGGDFRVGGAGNITTGDIQGDLRLRDTTGGQYIALQAAGATTTYTLTMPAAVGSDGQVLQASGGSGTLAWATISSSPPGSDTQLMYNNGGAFGAISGVTFDDANNRLYLDTTRVIIGGSSSYANGLTVNDGAEMRGIVEFSDGSAAAPGITFWNNGDTDTGIYRVNPNILGFAAQGDEVLTMHSASASAVNYLTMTNSATGNAPKIAAAGTDTNVGIEFSVQLSEGVKFSTTTGSSDTLTIKNGRKLEWALNTAGGSDSELMGYNDTAGAARSLLRLNSNVAKWVSRGPDGHHTISANSSTAGSGGEQMIAKFSRTNSVDGIALAGTSVTTTAANISAASTANNGYITLLSVPHANWKAVKANMRSRSLH